MPQSAEAFVRLQEQIKRKKYQDAIALVQMLFYSISSEEEALVCYEALFVLLPHFSSLGQLENNLFHLLASDTRRKPLYAGPGSAAGFVAFCMSSSGM